MKKLFSLRNLIYVLAALAAAALLETVTVLSYPQHIDISRADDLYAQSVLNENQTFAYNNCTLEGNVYTPSSVDPGLIVHTGSEDTRTVILELAQPLDGSTAIQLFYPDMSGDRNPGCVATVTVEAGQETVIIPLGGGYEFGYFWLDIDVPMVFADISESPLEVTEFMTEMEVPVSFFRAALFFLGALILILLGARYQWPRRIWDRILDFGDYFRECPGTVILGVLAIVLAALLGVLAELCWAIFRGRPVLIPRMIIYGALAVTAVVIFLLRRSLAFRPERIFLVLVLSAGFIMAVNAPISKTTWDDESHYRAAVEVSYLDHAVYTAADRQYISLSTSNQLSASAQRVQAEDLNSQNYVMDAGVGEGRTLNLERVGYLPMAAGLWLGRALGCSFSVTFCLGKLTNLLFYALVMYAAIRRLRSGKMILAVVGLFPTMVFQAANYSYDPVFAAAIFLAVAYLIGELQRPEEKLTLKNAVIIFAGFLVGMSFRVVYFPLILLLFFLPRKKFKNPLALRALRIGAVVLAVFVLATYLLPFLTSAPGSDIAMGDSRGGEDVNALEQFKFILSNPFRYAQILLGFLFGIYLLPSTALQYTVFFPYLENSVGHFHWVIFVLMLLVALTDRDRDSVYYSTWRVRLVSFLLVAVAIAVTATSMYVVFTAVGLETVLGCQPRYLVPLIFPALALCLNNRLAVPLRERIWDEWYNGAVLAVSGLVLLWNAFYIYLPYQL